MAKISELISQYVVSLYNGKIEGVVENVLFDTTTKKAKYLVVFNYDNDAKFVLPTSKIFSVGNGAVSIRNSSALNLYDSKELELLELSNPINSTCFQTNGDLLGTITDIVVNEKYNIEQLIINQDSEIALNSLASINENVVLVYEQNSKINIKNFYDKTRIKPNNSDTRIVNILEIKEANDNVIQTENKANSTIIRPSKTQVPNRAIANYNFLINRKVMKNILSHNGDLLIKQNTKINERTINLARLNGKLNELTKFSV